MKAYSIVFWFFFLLVIPASAVFALEFPTTKDSKAAAWLFLPQLHLGSDPKLEQAWADRILEVSQIFPNFAWFGAGGFLKSGLGQAENDKLGKSSPFHKEPLWSKLAAMALTADEEVFFGNNAHQPLWVSYNLKGGTAETQNYFISKLGNVSLLFTAWTGGSYNPAIDHWLNPDAMAHPSHHFWGLQAPDLPTLPKADFKVLQIDQAAALLPLNLGQALVSSNIDQGSLAVIQALPKFDLTLLPHKLEINTAYTDLRYIQGHAYLTLPNKAERALLLVMYNNPKSLDWTYAWLNPFSSLSNKNLTAKIEHPRAPNPITISPKLGWNIKSSRPKNAKDCAMAWLKAATLWRELPSGISVAIRPTPANTWLVAPKNFTLPLPLEKEGGLDYGRWGELKLYAWELDEPDAHALVNFMPTSFGPLQLFQTALYPHWVYAYYIPDALVFSHQFIYHRNQKMYALGNLKTVLNQYSQRFAPPKACDGLFLSTAE